MSRSTVNSYPQYSRYFQFYSLLFYILNFSIQTSLLYHSLKCRFSSGYLVIFYLLPWWFSCNINYWKLVASWLTASSSFLPLDEDPCFFVLASCQVNFQSWSFTLIVWLFKQLMLLWTWHEMDDKDEHIMVASSTTKCDHSDWLIEFVVTHAY